MNEEGSVKETKSKRRRPTMMVVKLELTEFQVEVLREHLGAGQCWFSEPWQKRSWETGLQRLDSALNAARYK